MLAREIDPTHMSFHSLMYASAMRANPDMASDVLRELGNSGLNPNQESYLLLVKACAKAKDPQRAEDTVKYIKAGGQVVSTPIYTQVVLAYLRAEKPFKAMEIVDDMCQVDGLHPDQEMYEVMMDFYRQT